MKKNGTARETLIDSLVGEASWLLTHADGLTFEARHEEAQAEWQRAADSAGQAACLLDAAGRHAEAAVQRVSAASCLSKVGRHVEAVSLLRAALSAPVSKPYQQRVAKLLDSTLRKATRTVKRPTRRRRAAGNGRASKRARKSAVMA